MTAWTAHRRHVLGWLVLPVLAVANGLVRDTTYGPALGYDLSHAVSVLPLLVLILAWARILDRRWPLPDLATAWRVGLIWLLLTLAFEFGLGALEGLTLATMLAEYDVTRGRVWPLIPIATLTGPVLVRRRRPTP
jgi:hypothetical protein